MRDKHERDAELTLKRFQLVLHLLAQLVVQRGEGFIQQEQARFVDHGAGNGHTLLLTTGKLMRLALGKRLQLYHAQGFGNPRWDLAGRCFLHPQAKRHVLKHGHVREQGIALKDGIDVAIFGWNLGYVLVLKMDMAVIDAFQPGDKAQDGGFAAAGGAEQREKLTVIDGQIKVGNDIFAIETFTNSFQLHQR